MLLWKHHKCARPDCTETLKCPGFPTASDRIHMARAAYDAYAEADGVTVLDFIHDITIAVSKNGGNNSHGLTEKQLQVALLIADGLSAKDVGKRLGLAPKTVEFHRGRACKAVGVDSTALLVRYLIREGLLKA